MTWLDALLCVVCAVGMYLPILAMVLIARAEECGVEKCHRPRGPKPGHPPRGGSGVPPLGGQR